MTTYEFSGNLLGRKVEYEYSPTWIVTAITLMRVGMGWILFQGGIVKVLDPTWSAAGFLTHAIPEGNPFMGLWAGFAGSPVIDFLVPWGLTLTGLGLMLGALTRWNAFWGAGMVVAGYLTYVDLTQTTAVCGPLGECDAVQNSVYAHIAGIPVAVLGLLSELEPMPD